MAVDDAVGAIVDALDRRSMWARTLLLFTTDNGGAINQQGSNKPLRGGKIGGFGEHEVSTPPAVSTFACLARTAHSC